MHKVVFYSVISVFCLMYTASFAQFGKIVDKDGFVNLREKPNANSKIVGTIKSNEFVYVFDDADANWFMVDYPKTDTESLHGNIHKSRVVLLENFLALKQDFISDNEVHLTTKNIKIVVKGEPFDYKKNKAKFKKVKHKEVGYVEEFYNNQLVWGTDFTIPKSHYKSIEVTYNKTKTVLPAKIIENLFNVSIGQTTAYFDAKTEELYLLSLNSDGAGAYYCLFVFEKGVFKQRKVIMPF